MFILSLFVFDWLEQYKLKHKVYVYRFDVYLANECDFAFLKSSMMSSWQACSLNISTRAWMKRVPFSLFLKDTVSV